MQATRVLEGVVGQWNIATTLTAMRAVAVLPALVLWWCAAEESLFLVVVCAAITDFLDGQVARWRSETTPLGWAADPLADKCFVNGLLVLAICQSKVADHDTFALLALLLCLVMLYDLTNTYHRWPAIKQALYGRRQQQSPVPVTWLSKGKTAYLFVIVAWLWLPSGWQVTSLLQPYLSLGLAVACVWVLGVWVMNVQRLVQ